MYAIRSYYVKYIPDLAAAQPRQFVSIQLSDIDLINKHFAGGGFIQAADHIE